MVQIILQHFLQFFYSTTISHNMSDQKNKNTDGENERVLARIVTIQGFKEIEGADRMHVAILKEVEWNAVVSKSDFKENDAAVYCEIASILPDIELFGFLKKSKESKMPPLKTKKIRGVLSQGLLVKMSDLKLTVKQLSGETINVEEFTPNYNVTTL